jgi:Helix-hairpin-helix motif
VIFISLFLLYTLVASAQTTPPEAAVKLPEGPGKEIVERECTACHTVERIVALRLSEEGWKNVLFQMSEVGVAMDPDDSDKLLAYLTKYLNKINVNQASAKELVDGLKLTRVQAEKIVEYRTANGKFKDTGDLKKVEIIASHVDTLRHLIEF